MNTGSETQIEAYGAGQLSRCLPCFFIAIKSVHYSLPQLSLDELPSVLASFFYVNSTQARVI